LILTCLFFNYCSQIENSDFQTFTFNKEFEIGLSDGDENYIFGSINDVEVDLMGNIYVLDGKMTRIVKFNKDGKFLLRFGKKGQGPGEFEFPESMVLDSEKRICVLGIGKVLIFDEEGKHLLSFPYNFYGIDIALDNKNNLILLGPRNDEIFHIYDRNGNYQYSYGSGFEIPNEFAKWEQARFMRLPIRLWSIENEVYVMNPYRFEIHVFKDAMMIDELSKDTPDYLRPEIKESVPGGFAGYVSDNLIQKSEGKLFIFYNGKTANWLDIFVDGRCIESLQVKGILRNIDERGRFYFAEEDDYLKLVLYRLKSENLN
jgi:hypothetical protein